MIKVTSSEGIEYIIDGGRYWPEEALKEALGCKDDDIFGEIKKLKQERDELKEKCDKLKKRANATYGVSCGYSGDKEPAFLCDVISYSWEFGSITDRDLMGRPTYRVRNNSIRVELDLTPTANYKGTFDLEDLKHYIQAYGREKKLGIGEASDIFDNPRYRFLSELSSELGFRTIVGPGNADKVEKDILRVVKSRNERAKDADGRREFLRKLTCELGVPVSTIKSSREEREADILERIGKLKEGNWPCENSATFAAYMRKRFPKECEKWKVAPLQEGSVHDWVQYIFGVLDEWRKRALKDEEERDAIYEELGLNPAFDDTEDVLASIKKLREDREKYKGMLNTWYGASCYGASCGDNVLPCYRDTCNNPKAIRERDAAKDALFELRAKIRDAYREIFNCEFEAGCGYVAALNDILKEFKFRKQLEEKAEEKAVGYKLELQHCREDILTVYREIFDCSNGDPEGSDKETLEDILTEYRNVASALNDTTEDLCKAKNSLSDIKRKYTDEIKLVSSVRAERDSNRAKYLVFLDKLAKVLDVSYSNPNYTPAKEQDILRAMKALKSAYNKLEKDYEELGKAYSSVLKWNNSYADIRRLLEVPADADAGVMVGALNKFMCDYEKLKESTASIDQLRQNWYSRYESEHERANGEHKRAEKCFGEIAALKTQVASLERSLNAAANEQVGLDAFRNECRKLRDEKAKVIKALGQDIWDDCVK